jgi:hypothetical protein
MSDEGHGFMKDGSKKKNKNKEDWVAFGSALSHRVDLKTL